MMRFHVAYNKICDVSVYVVVCTNALHSGVCVCNVVILCVLVCVRLVFLWVDLSQPHIRQRHTGTWCFSIFPSEFVTKDHNQICRRAAERELRIEKELLVMWFCERQFVSFGHYCVSIICYRHNQLLWFPQVVAVLWLIAELYACSLYCAQPLRPLFNEINWDSYDDQSLTLQSVWVCLDICKLHSSKVEYFFKEWGQWKDH